MVAITLMTAGLDAWTTGEVHPYSVGRALSVPPLGVATLLSDGILVTAIKVIMGAAMLMFIAWRMRKAGFIFDTRSSPWVGFGLTVVTLSVAAALSPLTFLPGIRYLWLVVEEAGGMLILLALAGPVLISLMCLAIGQVAMRTALGISPRPRFDRSLVLRITCSAVVWLVASAVMADAGQDVGAYLLGFVVSFVQSVLICSAVMAVVRSE